MKRENEDRIRRAKSWCEVGMQKDNPDEATFIFLWIAFNAAYGTAPTFKKQSGQKRLIQNFVERSERERVKDFIKNVVKYDTRDELRDVLTNNKATIEVLMKNQYIYEPFWNFIRQEGPNYRKWGQHFFSDNKQFEEDQKAQDTAAMLQKILARLYTLRNQIVHGGTTFGASSWGNSQLSSGAGIMKLLVPSIISIMETQIRANPETIIWGKVSYPRFKARN